MVYLKHLRQKIADERKEIEHTRKLLDLREALLQQQEKALDQYEAQLQGTAPTVGVEHAALDTNALLRPSYADISARRPPLNIGKQTNVSIYERIILEAGHPMKVADLVAAAEARGVVLRGKGDKAKMIRNALVNCKRFVNMGDNTWWIANRPIPAPMLPPSQESLMR